MAIQNSEYDYIKCNAVIKFYRHYGAHPPVSQHQTKRDRQLLNLFQELFSPRVELTDISQLISKDTRPSFCSSAVDYEFGNSALGTSVFEINDSCSLQNTVKYNPEDIHDTPDQVSKMDANHYESMEMEYRHNKSTERHHRIEGKDSNVLVGLVSSFNSNLSNASQYDQLDKTKARARMSFSPREKVSARKDALSQEQPFQYEAVGDGTNEHIGSQTFHLINEPASVGCDSHDQIIDNLKSSDKLQTKSDMTVEQFKADGKEARSAIKNTSKIDKSRKRKMNDKPLTVKKYPKRNYKQPRAHLDERSLHIMPTTRNECSPSLVKRRRGRQRKGVGIDDTHANQSVISRSAQDSSKPNNGKETFTILISDDHQHAQMSNELSCSPTLNDESRVSMSNEKSHTVMSDDESHAPILNNANANVRPITLNEKISSTVHNEKSRAPLSEEESHASIANDGSRPPMLNEGSRTLMANEESCPTIAIEESRPTIVNEESRALIANKGSRPLIANEGPPAPIVNEGSRPPMLNEGSRTPIANGETRPTIVNEESHAPIANDGSRPPMLNEGSRTLMANEESCPTIANEELRPTIVNEESRALIANKGSRPPIANEGPPAPIVNEESLPPIANEGSRAPIANEGSRDVKSYGHVSTPIATTELVAANSDVKGATGRESRRICTVLPKIRRKIPSPKTEQHKQITQRKDKEPNHRKYSDEIKQNTSDKLNKISESSLPHNDTPCANTSISQRSDQIIPSEVKNTNFSISQHGLHIQNKDLCQNQLPNQNDSLGSLEKHIQVSEAKLRGALLEKQQESEAQNIKYRELLKEEQARNDELLELKANLQSKEKELKNIADARKQMFKELANMRLVEHELLIRISEEQVNGRIQPTTQSRVLHNPDHIAKTVPRPNREEALIENPIREMISNIKTLQNVSQAQIKVVNQSSEMNMKGHLTNAKSSTPDIPIAKNIDAKQDIQKRLTYHQSHTITKSKPKNDKKTKTFPITRKLRRSKEVKSKATQLTTIKRNIKHNLFSDKPLSVSLDDMPPLEQNIAAMSTLPRNELVQPVSNNTHLQGNPMVLAARADDTLQQNDTNAYFNMTTNMPLALEHPPSTYKARNMSRKYDPAQIQIETGTGPDLSHNNPYLAGKHALTHEKRTKSTNCAPRQIQDKTNTNPDLDDDISLTIGRQALAHDNITKKSMFVPIHMQNETNANDIKVQKHVNMIHRGTESPPGYMESETKPSSVLKNYRPLHPENNPQTHIKDNSNSDKQCRTIYQDDASMTNAPLILHASISKINKDKRNVCMPFPMPTPYKPFEPNKQQTQQINSNNKHEQFTMAHTDTRPHTQVKEINSEKELQTRLKKEQRLIKKRKIPLAKGSPCLERKQSKRNTSVQKPRKASSNVVSYPLCPSTVPSGRSLLSLQSVSSTQFPSQYGMGQAYTFDKVNSISPKTQSRSKDSPLAKQAVPALINTSTANGIQTQLQQHKPTAHAVVKHKHYISNLLKMPLVRHTSPNPNWYNSHSSQNHANSEVSIPQRRANDNDMIERRQVPNKLNFHAKPNGLDQANRIRCHIIKGPNTNGDSIINHSATNGLTCTANGTRTQKSKGSIQRQSPIKDNGPKPSQPSNSTILNSTPTNVRPSGSDIKAGVTCAVCPNKAMFLCSACLRKPYCSQRCQAELDDAQGRLQKLIS